MFSSWRTTITGAISLLGGLCIVLASLIGGQPAVTPSGVNVTQQAGSSGDINFEGIGTGIAAISAGVGLFVARDNKVTSEQAKAGNQ